MKILRTLVVGLLIWFFGVLAFSISFYLPILENVELQANLVLLVLVPPIVWLGSWLYYKKGLQYHGLLSGFAFFAIATLMDILITVPVLIIPYGGSYYQFFTDIIFWGIGLEFITTTFFYWSINVKVKSKSLFNQSKES